MDIVRWIFQRMLECMPGASDGRQFRYSCKFRIFACIVFGTIGLWFAVCIFKVLPTIQAGQELQFEQGILTGILLLQMVWFATARVIHFHPDAAQRMAWLDTHQGHWKACCVKWFMEGGSLLMFIFASFLLGGTGMTEMTQDEITSGQFSIITMFSIYSCVIGIFGLIFVSWHDSLNLAASRRGPPKKQGAPPDTIDHLETCTYDESLFGVQEGQLYPEECAICLGAWEPSDRIKLTPCQHAFHEECLASWLTVARTCALCRQDLVEAIRDTAAPDSASPFDDADMPNV